MKNLNLIKASNELLYTFKSLYPLDITEKKDSYEIELGHDNREIWAFPLVAGTQYLDSAIHEMEEHRKVIPAALNRCSKIIDGVFLVGYYAKKVKNDDYEHGLVIIPANRGSKKANSELLTSYCFERVNLYKNMMSEDYFKQIEAFMNAYKSVCKKYWIQDTKLINTSFINRPVSTNLQSQAATSTWNTEIYPDFMRPASMIGDIFIDFMLCDHNLVYLHSEIDEDDSIWEFFGDEKIDRLYYFDSSLKLNLTPIDIKYWCETTAFELSSRKDLNYNTLYDIAVPGLKGSIINQGYSIGWCSKIAFMGIGLDKPLYITPNLLKEINDPGDFDQSGNDNKAYWRNRDIEYRKRYGVHNLVKVCDDLITESQAKNELIEACKVALQTCKNPLKEVQKGINKYVSRYLKGLARGLEEKTATDYLNIINSVKLCADEQEILLKIINWARQTEQKKHFIKKSKKM